MPGLFGLAGLDSFAFGGTMVTNAYPYHSPENEYLNHGKTSLICDSWQVPIQYADSIADPLSNSNRLASMKSASLIEACHYSV